MLQKHPIAVTLILLIAVSLTGCGPNQEQLDDVTQKLNEVEKSAAAARKRLAEGNRDYFLRVLTKLEGLAKSDNEDYQEISVGDETVVAAALRELDATTKFALSEAMDLGEGYLDGQITLAELDSFYRRVQPESDLWRNARKELQKRARAKAKEEFTFEVRSDKPLPARVETALFAALARRSGDARVNRGYELNPTEPGRGRVIVNAVLVETDYLIDGNEEAIGYVPQMLAIAIVVKSKEKTSWDKNIGCAIPIELPAEYEFDSISVKKYAKAEARGALMRFREVTFDKLERAIPEHAAKLPEFNYVH